MSSQHEHAAGHGQQEGNSARAAQAILALVSADNPPLGRVALATLPAKIDQVQQALDAGRAVGAGAVYSE